MHKKLTSISTKRSCNSRCVIHLLLRIPSFYQGCGETINNFLNFHGTNGNGRGRYCACVQMTGSPSGNKKRRGWFPCDFVCCLESGVKIPVIWCWKEAASLCGVSLKSSRKQSHFCHIFWCCGKCNLLPVWSHRDKLSVCVCGVLILESSSQDKVRGLCCVLLLRRFAETVWYLHRKRISICVTSPFYHCATCCSALCEYCAWLEEPHHLWENEA